VIVGLQIETSETRLAWNTYLADLGACGFAGVRQVTSLMHVGLKGTIGANRSPRLGRDAEPLRREPDGVSPCAHPADTSHR
jgi:hypothetical protein